MFEESLRLFDEYYLAQNGKPGFNTRAAVEFRLRITQLEYFLGEIRERVDTVTAWQATRTGRMLAALATLEERSLAWDSEWPDDIKLRFGAPLQTPLNVSDVSFEIETLTEAFYFFVGRLRQLLKREDGNRPLHGLGDLPHDGAARVRDKLLEHYRPDGESPSGAGHQFAFGGPHGPVLRLEQNDEPDPGLYANAEKLARDLENKLRGVLPPPNES